MMDPLSIVEKIVSVAKKIYEQVQLAKANQKRCHRLADLFQIRPCIMERFDLE